MVITRTGSNIPSANVSQNRTYVDGRVTENLHEVGAITEDARDLFQRTDGVLANNPVDGRVQIDEMLHMETANQQAALFPDEQQLLPQLWRFMEWRPGDAAGSMPALPGPLAINEQLTLPTGIDFGAQFPIADLPQPLQRSAQRVQLVANGDANATTISINDITDVEQNPARFTANDLRQLGQAKTAIENALRAQAQPNLSAVVQVPQLGLQTFTIPNTGSATVAVEVDTKLTETRHSSYSSTYRQNEIRSSLQLHRESNLSVDLPADHKAIFINTQDASEVVVDAGKSNPRLPAGDYRMEVWHDGDRVDNIDVTIPEVPKTETLRMNDFVGWDLQDQSGQPLDRSVLAYTTNHRTRGGSQSATFGYNVPQPPNVDVARAQAMQLPTIPLPPGSYEVDMQQYGNAQVHVVNPNVILMEVEGTTHRLQPRMTSSGYWFEANSSNRRIAFDIRDREAVVADRTGGRDRNYVQTKVTNANRVA